MILLRKARVKQRSDFRRNSVAIARRSHLFPSRTQKLSFLAPKILGGRPPGNIGRCRNNTYPLTLKSGGFFYAKNPPNPLKTLLYVGFLLCRYLFRLIYMLTLACLSPAPASKQTSLRIDFYVIKINNNATSFLLFPKSLSTFREPCICFARPPQAPGRA